VTPLPPDLVTLLCDKAAAPEDVRSVEALATLWLADHRKDTGDGEDLCWSDQAVFELDGYPEHLWLFCLAAIAGAETPWQIVVLAAGPLEDLIASQGADFIDRIEEQAQLSSRFRFALTGVWPQGNRGTVIWARVEAARGEAMAAGIDAGGALPPR